ncbi:MAG TPA: protease complex subunit PrcB family protein [Myxococcales bacterium]|nr:protease complex subunit PrcB family protein [Myxococcales bacterium]
MRWVLALAAALVACGNGQGGMDFSALFAVDQGRFTPDQRYTAVYSGFDQPAQLVIRDAGGWAAFWDQMHQGQSPVPALPAVDFGRQMVIAAAMGTQHSGGYAIAIERVSFGSEVIVGVLATSPGHGCVVTAALTKPVDAVVVSRSDAPVRFQESAALHDC